MMNVYYGLIGAVLFLSMACATCAPRIRAEAKPECVKVEGTNQCRMKRNTVKELFQ